MKKINRSFSALCLFSTLMLFLANTSLSYSEWQPPEHFTGHERDTAIGGGTDGNGNAIAIVSDEISNEIIASYFDGQTQTWGPNEFVASPAAIFSTLKLAMDQTGTALVIWANEDSETGDDTIRTAYYNGSSWLILSPDPLSPPLATFPGVDIAMDGNGRGIATWSGPAVSTSFFSGGSWGAITTLGSGSSPTTAYASDGTAVVARNDSGTVKAKYFNGSSWQIVADVLGLIDDTISVVDLGMGMDSNGNAKATWIDPSGHVVVSSFSASTSTWSAPVPVSIIPGNESSAIAVAPNGTAVLIWIDSSLQGLVSSFNGTSWSSPTIFATNVHDPYGGNQVASVSVDNVGNALIIYGNGIPEILSVSLPIGGSLGPTLFIQRNEDASDIYAISALSSFGRGFAFWREDSEGPEAFAAAFIPNPLPPSNLTDRCCENRFGAQSDRINILTWTPSEDPTVVSYYLRRNGILIAVIPASGPYIFYDHNRKRKVNDVYTLTSVNSGGLECEPIVTIGHCR